jgi:hypothetical protein
MTIVTSRYQETSIEDTVGWKILSMCCYYYYYYYYYYYLLIIMALQLSSGPYHFLQFLNLLHSL